MPARRGPDRHRRDGDRAAGGGAGRRGSGRLRDRRRRRSRRPSPRPGCELLDGEAGREADAVIVSGHRGFDYDELLTATLALQRGAALFATSRDPTLPMPGGAWPGTGAILAAVETASRRAGRDRRQARAPPLRAGAGADRRRRAGGDGRRPDRLRHRGRAARRAGDDPRPQRRLDRARRPRPPSRLPTTCSTTSPRLLRERRGRRARAERPPRASPSPAIFAVTFCGLLAVGAVLPVLPRYVHGPLDGGNIAVGVVIGSYAITGLLLRPFAGRFADRRGRKPTVLRRLAAGRARRLPLPAAARHPRADRRPARARRRRGHGLHRRLGLDRRPGAARAARAG